MEIELFKIYELNETGRKAIDADKLVFIEIDLQTGYYFYISQQLNNQPPAKGLMNPMFFNQVLKLD